MKTEAMLRGILDAATTESIWLFDYDGVALYANPTALAGVDKTADEVIGRDISGFIPPEVHQPRLMKIQHVINTGLPVEFEDFRGGINFRHRLYPVRGDSGAVTSVACFSHDISSEKAAQAANEALRIADAKLVATLEQMSDGFASFDREWRYTYVNSAAAEMFKVEPASLLGKTIWEMWPAAYHLPVGINFRSSMERNEPTNFETYYPEPLDRWFDCRCHPTSEGLATFFTDITERKRAENELKELNEDLECRVAARTAELRERDRMLLLQSRQAALGEMIGNIAHQWRQPLNNLGLTIQELLLFYDLGKLDRAFLANNVESSMQLIKHMSATIEDFRNYFKPDKERADFRLSDAITKTLALLKDSFKDRHIKVEINIEDGLIINGYSNEFAQALLNILNNARDVLIEREIDNPKVFISAFMENSKAVTTITDNAGGIPAEIIDKLFDPYFTTKGPQQGTGIGLYMSKTIIEKNLGGRLSARNVASGAEFRMEI